MDRLAFVHIPKTGGSKFVEKVIDLWPKEQVSPHTGIQGFMTDPNPHKYHFTAGHVFYPKIRQLLHPDMLWLTIFRDPIERVYSHWNHLKKFNLTDCKTFQEFVYEKHHYLASNLMARHVAWWPEDYTKVPPHSQFIEELPMPLSDDELYKRAKSSLEEFWYVGVQDRWVEVVKRVYDSFGLPLPSDTVQKESRNYQALMSEELLRDLRKFNAVDIELYNEYRGR